jgi:hypothetical protein
MWWVVYEATGQLFYTGTTDREEAERILDEVRDDLHVILEKTIKLVWRD